MKKKIFSLRYSLLLLTVHVQFSKFLISKSRQAGSGEISWDNETCKLEQDDVVWWASLVFLQEKKIFHKSSSKVRAQPFFSTFWLAHRHTKSDMLLMASLLNFCWKTGENCASSQSSCLFYHQSIFRAAECGADDDDHDDHSVLTLSCLAFIVFIWLDDGDPGDSLWNKQVSRSVACSTASSSAFSCIHIITITLALVKSKLLYYKQRKKSLKKCCCCCRCTWKKFFFPFERQWWLLGIPVCTHWLQGEKWRRCDARRGRKSTQQNACSVSTRLPDKHWNYSLLNFHFDSSSSTTRAVRPRAKPSISNEERKPRELKLCAFRAFG